MSFYKVAVLLSLTVMGNAAHALVMPDADIRIEPSGAGIIFPTNSLTPIIGFPQFNVGAGASLSISSPSPSWSISNRAHDNIGSLINGISNGGTIQLISPGGLILSGSTITGTRTALSVSAVPEAETYAMLLAGLGLIGAIIRRRHI